MLKFARCMREHGVKVDDPKGGGIAFKATPGEAGRLDAAQKACDKYMRGAVKPPSKAQQASIKENALKFSQCMREHGVDFPDPQVDGGRVKIGPGPGSGFNPEDPTVQAAQKACQHILGPGPKGGPAGGPGPAKETSRSDGGGGKGGAQLSFGVEAGGP
jgi:hypothetical protein